MTCRKILILVFICFVGSFVLAQGPPPAQPTQLVTNKLWVAPESPAPQQVPSASVQVSGAAGQATFFYWIVSKYTIGNSTPAGPFTITNAPNTLNGSNFDVVRWNPVSDLGVTYDVLRTATPVMPSGPCGCAVATAVAGSSTNDQSASLNAYTVTTLDPNVLNFTVQSEVQGLGSSHLILRQNGAFVSDLSVGGAGSLPAGVVPGSALVSNGIGALVPPVYQIKAIYDARDWMTCDGSTDASNGMNALLAAIGSQDSAIYYRGSVNSGDPCRIGNTLVPGNITNNFEGGGAIKLISSSTAPGGAGWVNGTSGECGAVTACSAPALSTTAGNTLVVMAAPYPGFTFKFTSVTDTCGDLYYHLQQSKVNQPRNIGAWVASNIHGGTCTVTATANGSLTNAQVMVEQFSGLGPVAAIDGKGSSTNTSGTTMTSGSAATTAGSLLIGYGGQPFTGETCTAGAGYTQPPGLAGQSTSGFLCSEYLLSGAGGSTTATQAITVDPAPGSWVYALLPLKPGNATLTVLGGILDPDLHQIFLNGNGTATQGAVDFTGATVQQAILPEWWGAAPNTDIVGTLNLPALQAAWWAAYGCGPFICRTNGSGLQQFNRELHFSGLYNINGEIQSYHVNSFKITGVGRLFSGINQTATNKRIIDGQNMAYGSFENFSFSTQAAQDASHPLVNLDSGLQGADISTQFVDFKTMGFNGNGVSTINFQCAPTGVDQCSNVNFWDTNSLGASTACYQFGTATNLAQNALDNSFIQGDIQGCPLYGIAVYGGNVNVRDVTFENGFTAQTGFDIFCQAPQFTCDVQNVRSESRRLIAGGNIVVRNSQTINQALFPTPGTTFPVFPAGASIIMGSNVGGDGHYYKITAQASPFGGAGTPTATILASAGSSTTIVNTNETIPGSNTIKIFSAGETVTQSVTGAAGTLLNSPSSTGTITGVATGQFTFGETITQAVTGVTATEQAPSPAPGGTSLFAINFSGTADSTHTWTGGTSGATFAPSSAPVFSATTMLITAHTGAPDNSHTWVGGTSAAVFVPTAVPAGPNYTVNAFTGFLASTLAGTNAGCYGVVSSNTATVITVAAWLTHFQFLPCTAPDNTSTFIVEPNWGIQFTSGGMTWADMAEDGIAGGTGAGLGIATLENVDVPGDQINIGSAVQKIKFTNVTTTRSDWANMTSGNAYNSSPVNLNDLDVYNRITVQQGNNTRFQAWTLPRINHSNVFLGGINPSYLGSKNLIFSCGDTIAGTPTACNDVSFGGRSDPDATNDISRNIAEYRGTLGPGSPIGANLNATQPGRLQGGLSTGTGTPLPLEVWIGGSGASGSAPNSGTRRWYWDAPSGNYLADTDNTEDIGNTVAHRPRSLYLSNSLNVQDPVPFGSMQTNTSAACETTYGITTLSVAGTTTDTGLTCLPANSIIDAVVYRITTTITTAANFTIGDATTAGRFCSTQSTLTAGTTGVCFVQADQTAAAGPRQTAAAKVRVTTNVNPGAGAIRLIVYYHTWVAPTS